MARYITTSDRIRRTRWARFLGGLVGKGRSISVAALHDKLAALTNRSGDARGEIYDYLREEQTVGMKRAFMIGESLRQLGVQWSSGPIGLYMAGYFADFTRYIGAVHAVSTGTAITFAAFTALLTDPIEAIRREAQATLAGLWEDFEKQLEPITPKGAWNHWNFFDRLASDNEMECIAQFAESQLTIDLLEEYLRTWLLKWAYLHAPDFMRARICSLLVREVTREASIAHAQSDHFIAAFLSAINERKVQ